MELVLSFVALVQSLCPTTHYMWYITGLFDRDFYVIDTCHSQGIPVATVIGGGYQRDINALSVRHTIVHRAATKVIKLN